MNKNKRAHIRLTEEEKEILKEQAGRYKLTISSFLRNLAFNYPLKNITDPQSANELLKTNSDLKKVGELLKNLIDKSKEKDNDEQKIELRKALKELEKIQHIMKVQAFSIFNAKEEK